MPDESNELVSHLSRIETLWSVVRRAHEAPTSESSHHQATAQRQLLDQYGTAIRRYLLAAIKDANQADDIFQEFALKFVRGEFRKADPQRGKFRFYVKTVLHNLIRDYKRKNTRLAQLEDADAEVDASSTAEIDQQEELFLIEWREDLLARTWDALEQSAASGKSQYFSVLTLRVQNPASSYEQLASQLSEIVGKPLTNASARVLVHRAREKFARLLIDQVANSLDNPALDQVEQELAELRLLDYCRDLIAKS